MLHQLTTLLSILDSNFMKTYSNKIFIVCTCLILLFPTLDRLVSFSENFPLTERRAKKKKPEFNGKVFDYVQNYDEYYKTAFGGRNIFIHLYSLLKYFVFKTSPFPDMAIIGKDDYFFLGNNSGQVLDSHNGKRLLSDRAIQRIVGNIEANYTWCQERGIEYYLFIAPDKHTIYADKLPDSYNQKLVTRNLDKLSSALLVANMPNIDTRARLMLLKDKYKLYAKTDSHWNDNGAFFSYQKVIEYIRNNIPSVGPTLGRNDFDIKDQSSSYKTTTDMLNISRFIQENDITYVPNQRSKYKYNKQQNELKIPSNYVGLKGNYEDRYESSHKNGLRALVFKDSFSNRLKKFLIPHFENTVFIENFHKFDKQLIQNEKPDIIIHEIVERSAMYYLLNY